ncbi:MULTISPECIES: hypothetical protein [Bradyrhizobium]|uniref:hypothetical protein n=1 Tax=Bradyrhizobium TaxID=374 RepID=UPI000480902F|nr:MULTISPECIES: hypothetical protein [Bradyrhizobium]UFW50562.1 hypothetical protein BaraCB756_05795 [Bradyrhizobium arachidis]
MPRSTNRNLSKSADLLVIKEELMTGRRIVVASSAGLRLSGRVGIIVGRGGTATQVRVLIEGTKRFVTLHARYVDLLTLNPNR